MKTRLVVLVLLSVFAMGACRLSNDLEDAKSVYLKDRDKYDKLISNSPSAVPFLRTVSLFEKGSSTSSTVQIYIVQDRTKTFFNSIRDLRIHYSEIGHTIRDLVKSVYPEYCKYNAVNIDSDVFLLEINC